MQKKLLMEKLIAIIIIFSMLFMDCLPILSSISFAAENFEDNVKINVYISSKSEEKENPLTICDASDEELSIKFNVNVQNGGYLRNGTFKLGDNLNFNIKKTSEVEIKENQFKIRDVNANETEEMEIPIEFDRQETFDHSYLSKTNHITFSGVYVDNDGDEHRIEKELELKLSWNDELKPTIEHEFMKNLDYERDGIASKILQSSIKVSGENKTNSIPLLNSKLEIGIPQIEGMKLNDVKVDVDRLAYTQGREDYDIEASDVSYDIIDSKLIITAGNNENEGKIYNSYGEDAYIITYFYEGESTQLEPVKSEIEVTVNDYAGNNAKEKIETECDLTQPIGPVVNHIREDKFTQISKGYLIADSISPKYEIAYTKKDVLNISRAELIGGLEITDEDEYFVCENDENLYGLEGISNYQATEFSRENLVSIFGEEGYIQILNSNDEILYEITFDKEPDENGNYVIKYEEKFSKIKINTSRPVADGTLFVVSKKMINSIPYQRNIVNNFTKLVNTSRTYVLYGEGIIDDLGIAQSNVSISQTKSDATLEMAQTELSSIVANRNVNFQIHLNNNNDTSDLYENPVFEIRFPQAIKEIDIKNIDLFYGNNELEIANVEGFKNGDNNIIRVTLKGTQSSYNINKASNGTVISLDADIIVDEFVGSVSEMIEMHYCNSAANTYNNEQEWSMVIPGQGTNGYDSVQISYIAPEELIIAQASETEKEENKENDEEEPATSTNTQNGDNRISSVKQDADSELLEEGAEAKKATMYISILNNSGKSYSDFRILGRIPFAGNKDITTGEDLGTTVDTILESGIVSENDNMGYGYTVYYSENGEATDDLSDPSNGWEQEIFKDGAIKSFLIVINKDFILEPNYSLEFSYDYIIPENLKPGDAIFGTYSAYYKEANSQKSEKVAPGKIGYQTIKMAKVTPSIGITEGSLKEFSDVEYGISLLNESNVNAKNVVASFTIPKSLSFKALVGDNISGEQEENTIRVTIPNIPANKEYFFKLRFYVNRKTDEITTAKIDLKVTGDNIEEVNISTNEDEIQENRFEIEDNLIYKDPLYLGINYDAFFRITNKDQETYYNVRVVKKLSSPIQIISSEQLMDLNVNQLIDTENQEIIWTIPEFKPNDSLSVKYTYRIGKPDNNQPINEAEIAVDINLGEGIAPIYSVQKINYYQPLVTLERTNNADVGYANPDEMLTYEYKITNNSAFELNSFDINMEVSDNSKISYVKAVVEDEVYEIYINDTSKDIGSIFIPAGSCMYVSMYVSVNENATGYVKSDVNVKINEGNTLQKDISTYTKIEDETNKNSYELAGAVYIDTNANLNYDDTDDALGGTIVNLYDSETDERVDSKITDISGRYRFDNLEDKKYFVKFNYDDTEYTLSRDTSGEFTQNTASVINVENKYVTDNIEVTDKSVSNIDLGLTRENVFDLKLDMTSEKMTVQNSNESNEFVNPNSKLSKVDINPKLLNDSKVLIEYKITVTNQGTISGTASKIVDYMPKDMEFDSSLNPDWYIGSDGNIYTRVLEDTMLEPGESKELSLILIRNVTETNTGLLHNSCEIASAINDMGILDIDSTPENKLDEDDYSFADSIIGVSTGLPISSLPIILTSIICIIPIAVVIWKVIDKRRYV